MSWVKKCPHCGNANPALIEGNGPRPDTYLCVAKVPVEECSFDRATHAHLDVDANGLTACGMQWSREDSE